MLIFKRWSTYAQTQLQVDFIWIVWWNKRKMSGNCKQFGKSSINTLNKVLTKDETWIYLDNTRESMWIEKLIQHFLDIYITYLIHILWMIILFIFLFYFFFLNFFNNSLKIIVHIFFFNINFNLYKSF